VKINVQAVMIAAVRKILKGNMPEISDAMKTRPHEISNPFLLWIMGPGISVIFTQIAPNEIANPISNKPMCLKKSTGASNEKVMRIPSDIAWLKKKYGMFEDVICRIKFKTFQLEKDSKNTPVNS
jgi:hypothetical protein